MLHLGHLAQSKRIPRRFIPVIKSSDDLVFGTLTIKREVKISNGKKKEHIFLFKKREQKAILDFLVDESDTNDDLIIGISSVPNDLLASQATGLIINGRLKRLDNLGTNFLFVNVGIMHLMPNPFEWLADKLMSDIPLTSINTVVLYNLSGDEDPKLVRGTLDYLNDRLRIVVISGMHFFNYFDNYIKYPLNGGIHIVGTKKPLSKAEFYLVKKYKKQSEKDDLSQDIEVPIFLPSTPFIKEIRKRVKPK